VLNLNRNLSLHACALVMMLEVPRRFKGNRHSQQTSPQRKQGQSLLALRACEE
jgi:hypothetical protein